MTNCIQMSPSGKCWPIVRWPGSHVAVAVGLSQDDCSISVQFYRHCKGTVGQPCRTCLGYYKKRVSQEQTINLGPKWNLKPRKRFSRIEAQYRCIYVIESCNQYKSNYNVSVEIVWILFKAVWSWSRLMYVSGVNIKIKKVGKWL